MKMHTPERDDRAKVTVILIHGTWPRRWRDVGARYRAAWCEETSLCRQSLQSALAATVDFRVFEWRGHNSPNARLDAAAALDRYIEGIYRCRPEVPIILIAHSHAGNIVLYAAREAECASRIRGAAFLSTPFLHVAPRLLGTRLARKLELAASVAVVALVILLYVCLCPTSAKSLYAHLHSLTQREFWLMFAPIGLCFGLLGRYVVIPGLRTLHRKNHDYARKLALPTVLPFPTLIIRAAGDEAAGALGATQFVSHMATRILRTILKWVPAETAPFRSEKPRPWDAGLSRLPRSTRVGLLISVSAVIFPIGLWMILGAMSLRFSPIVNHFIAGCALLIMLIGVFIMTWETLVQLLLLPLFVIFNLIAAAAAASFGWRFALATFGLDISAESTPPGSWNSLQLSPSTDPYEERVGLSHGTHSDPIALAELARWLRELILNRSM